MTEIVNKKRLFLIATLGISLLFGATFDASAQKKSKKKKAATTENVNASAEPDKILYERAAADLKKGRYVEGRLALQTLINTYPDSEYLAKAKLAVADSYYKEGGTSNLTQSIAEYKDFITFFPFLDEAAYAQMQVGMAHFRMMEKSDRDNVQAQSAEDEFQTFLLKYPQSPLAPQAEQHLREAQEVLADGDYKIAHFYFTKGDYRASAARLMEVTGRYPLYSKTDDALWMLGQVYMAARKTTKNEDLKNYWAGMAAKCYDRIVSEYPLSNRAKDAKSSLVAMGMAVPPADPAALARMQKEEEYQKKHTQNAIMRTPMSMLKSSPDTAVAAHSGAPNLNPPDDSVAASEVLKPNANKSEIGVSQVAPGEGSSGSDAPPVDATVTSGSADQSGSSSGTGIGVQIITPSAESGTATPAATGAADDPPASTPTTESGAPTASSSATQRGTSGEAGRPASSPNPTSSTSPEPGQDPAPAAGTSSSASTSPPSGQTAAPGNSSDDPKQESTSKKKKGLRKLVPW